MSIPLFTNNASTTLALGIGISDTTINLYVGSGSLFPSPVNSNYFYISMISSSTNSTEIMKCTGRSGDTLTVVRAQDGTSAQTWSVGDRVELRVTAASLNFFANGSSANPSTATQVNEFTATQGQTTFTLSFNYLTNSNNLVVFVNGSKQIVSVNYNENSSSTIQFLAGLNVGDLVEVIYNLPFASGSVDASNITYNQGGTGAVTTNVQAKLAQTVSVKDFGAVGDGVTDDTTAIQAALNAGAIEVVFPSGTYKTTGVTVSSSSTLAGIRFISGSQILLTTGSGRIALDLQKPVFSIWGVADVKSTGTMSDSNSTIGIRCGTSAQGLSYCRIEAARFENFSLHGVVFYQPVYCGIERLSGYSSTYGLSILPNAALVGGSTVEIGPSYISGCTRGINADSCVYLTLREPVLEYCGSSTTTNGALNFVKCGSVTVIDRYGEANARNMVKDDSMVVFINGYMLAATAADIITYTGTAGSQRGTSLLQSYKLGIRRIDYDTIDNEDLVIGSNLTVPKTGGSVIFGNETHSVNSGTLTSATWTTVATIPAAEYASTVNTNAFYEYVCYAGSSDLSTGFDAGTLMNGTLRSYSGSLPAWLRFSSGNIQMNVTSSSYGLTYKIVLRRVYPG